MSRGRWIAAGATSLLIATLLLWAWAGDDAPLVRFWQRDLTWQAIEARGAWRVGLDPSFPPFELLEASGAPAGYDVELAHLLAAQWGLDTEIVAIGFDSLLDALQAARIDAIISAYPYDERLTRDVAYSQPYFDAGLQLAVRQDSSISGVEDLVGRRVAVEWGSEGDMIGRQLQRDGLDVELVPFETPQEAVDALMQGNDVDALLVDGVTLRSAQAAGATLSAAGPYLTSNPYVIVLPRRAPELLERVNQGLEVLRRNRSLERLEAQWFGHYPEQQ
jgi:polar amino acid transport system substrate-binding protein